MLQKAAKQDPQTNKLTSMLQLLVTGTIEELEAFQKTNPGFIEQQGVLTFFSLSLPTCPSMFCHFVDY